MIEVFLKYGHMLMEVIKINITLIQKIDDKKQVNDYRFVSLCSVVYKFVQNHLQTDFNHFF